MLVEGGAGILLRKYPPRFVIGGAVLTFGVLGCCTSLVKSYASIMVIRLLLGLAEGVSYNVYLYTSVWYKPHELARRTGKSSTFRFSACSNTPSIGIFLQGADVFGTAMVYGMSPLAGAFSGLIAYGIQKNLEGKSGIKSWQWLFIIEGVLTIALGLLIVALLPALPDTVAAKGSWIFPHQGQRSIISHRMRQG